MREPIVLCVAVGLAVAAVGLAGCGSSSGGSGESATLWVDTYLQPFADNASQTPRWMDIADNSYAPSFVSSFVYPTSAVRLGYTTAQTPLQFTVTAGYHALKPNFCYQMKLEGPPVPWGTDAGSDFVNGEFGYNGRWWCDSCNRALTDDEVGSGAHSGHVVKGYLYFDFLVTAGDGSVAQTSTADSSYHVTWKTSQRPRTEDDGPLRSYLVAPKADQWAYSGKFRAKTIGLYGEQEPGRDLTGQVQLASGLYQGVEFRLTEESFHSTRPKGGKWRTVMSASGLTFQIP